VAELGAVRDADVLVDEIAQRFAVTRVAGTPLIRSMAEYIGAQRVLLVLDNCEQIISSTAALCRDLLTACPNLRVLATSRERLGVTGEALYRVPSLSLPDVDATVEEAYRHDAVRLFAERSQLASSEFVVTPDNVEAVVSICRRLDGIPLALELAAARTRSLSPAQILDRLDERFRLLTAADRNAEGRQRTLLSTIEWSHDLLGLTSRCSSVGSACSPRASRSRRRSTSAAVTGSTSTTSPTCSWRSSTSRWSPPTRLATARPDTSCSRRFESSLVVSSTRPASAIVSRSDTPSTMPSWQHSCRPSSAPATSGERWPGSTRTKPTSERHFAHTLGARQLTTAGRLVGGLGYLWYAAGQHREGLQWCDDLFALEPDLSDQVLADALHSQGSLLGVMGDPDRAIAALERQVEIRRRLNDPERLGAALNNLGDWYFETGRYEDGERALAEAIAELRKTGTYGVSLAIGTLASGRFNQGRYDEAARDFAESLEEARRVDHAHSIAVAMGGIGRSLVALGRPDAARPLLIEARERFDELTMAPGNVDMAIFLGVAERDLGDLQSSARHLLAALTETGIHWSDDADVWTLQFAASVISDRATAAVLVGAATAAYERSDVDQPAFVTGELGALRDRLETELGPEELGRHLRTGERRTRQEAIDIGRAALTEYLAEQADNRTPQATRGRVR
jgi:tetratricopeptide (TPR) repeat protein